MKHIFFLLGLILAGQFAGAQKETDLDISPMDVSFYPSNYPMLKMKGQAVAAEPLARLLYSRPQKKGRTIFGEEIKYNEVWRLGANEATEIELFKNGTIGGKKILKGRYTLYCIPTETKWTIVINKDNYSWGSFTYKSQKDVARFDVPVQKVSEPTEALSMYFDKNNLNILWDLIKVQVPVSF
ncbi:MAG TPA: DUF2911 domain-containing protein [Segetibacter sp.]